jgi:hypothetical protein
MENKHLFPVGNIDLYIADYASSKEVIEIDLFGDDGSVITETATDVEAVSSDANVTPVAVLEKTDENDGSLRHLEIKECQQ